MGSRYGIDNPIKNIKMKNAVIFIAIMILGCQNQDSRSKSLVNKIAQLCNCQNSEGKTIEVRAKEILGQDFYISINSVEAFSDKLEAHPDKLEVLIQTTEKEFLENDQYLLCAKQYLNNINLDRGLSKEEESLLTYFNKEKEFTVYRVLPFLIAYIQEIN